MVLALVCAVPVVLSHTGGLTALGEYVGSIEPRVTGWWFTWKELLAFGMAFGFGITAAPYEMTRYYSMRDVATVRYAIGISMLLQVLIGSSVMILGIGIRGIYPYLPLPDQASSVMAATVMSPLLGALFVIAMLSAIMSTVNSILLVTGGAFAHDLYKRLVNPAASQRRLVWVNRLSIVALGVVPFWMATLRLGDVQAIVIEQAKFIASFFFVPVVLGLNWRRGTKEGAIAAMAVGFAACLVWTFTLQRELRGRTASTRWRWASRLSALAFVVVSRLTPPTPDREPRDILRRTLKRLGRPARMRAGLAIEARHPGTGVQAACRLQGRGPRSRGARRHPARRAAGAARSLRHPGARVGHRR